MDCRSIVSVSYLNVNRTVEMKMRRVRCDILAHRLLTAGWVEKLLSSDVSQEGSWTRSAFDALFGFRCWSATEQKQSLLISQTPPVTLNLLSSSSRNSVFQSYMTSHHDPPSSDTLSTSAVFSGEHEHLSYKTMAVTLPNAVRPFRGVRSCLFLPTH